MRTIQWSGRLLLVVALGQPLGCSSRADAPAASGASGPQVALDAPLRSAPATQERPFAPSSSAPSAAPHGLATTDIAVPAKASAEATVVARLRWMPEGSVHCGVLHVATVMQYEIIRVESGEVVGKHIFVAHGCPELPRAQYGAGARTLQAFRIGELHRLVLNTAPPKDGPSIMQEPALPTFWCRQADPAT